MVFNIYDSYSNPVQGKTPEVVVKELLLKEFEENKLLSSAVKNVAIENIRIEFLGYIRDEVKALLNTNIVGDDRIYVVTFTYYGVDPKTSVDIYDHIGHHEHIKI
jgi:hypothetical protein